jgi:hypothetical protein
MMRTLVQVYCTKALLLPQVRAQVIQTIAILLMNTGNQRSLFYLLSNGHINALIVSPLPQDTALAALTVLAGSDAAAGPLSQPLTRSDAVARLHAQWQQQWRAPLAELLASAHFTQGEEETTAYLLSLLKTLSLALNQDTVHFFLAPLPPALAHALAEAEAVAEAEEEEEAKGKEEEEEGEKRRRKRSSARLYLPLYAEALRYFDHSDPMVRAAVRTVALSVFRLALQDAGVRDSLLLPLPPRVRWVQAALQARISGAAAAADASEPDAPYSAGYDRIKRVFGLPLRASASRAAAADRHASFPSGGTETFPQRITHYMRALLARADAAVQTVSRLTEFTPPTPTQADAAQEVVPAFSSSSSPYSSSESTSGSAEAPSSPSQSSLPSRRRLEVSAAAGSWPWPVVVPSDITRYASLRYRAMQQAPFPSAQSTASVASADTQRMPRRSPAMYASSPGSASASAPSATSPAPPSPAPRTRDVADRLLQAKADLDSALSDLVDFLLYVADIFQLCEVEVRLAEERAQAHKTGSKIGQEDPETPPVVSFAEGLARQVAAELLDCVVRPLLFPPLAAMLLVAGGSRHAADSLSPESLAAVVAGIPSEEGDPALLMDPGIALLALSQVCRILGAHTFFAGPLLQRLRAYAADRAIFGSLLLQAARDGGISAESVRPNAAILTLQCGVQALFAPLPGRQTTDAEAADVHNASGAVNISSLSLDERPPTLLDAILVAALSPDERLSACAMICLIAITDTVESFEKKILGQRSTAGRTTAIGTTDSRSQKRTGSRGGLTRCLSSSRALDQSVVMPRAAEEASISAGRLPDFVPGGIRAWRGSVSLSAAAVAAAGNEFLGLDVSMSSVSDAPGIAGETNDDANAAYFSDPSASRVPRDVASGLLDASARDAIAAIVAHGLLRVPLPRDLNLSLGALCIARLTAPMATQAALAGSSLWALCPVLNLSLESILRGFWEMICACLQASLLPPPPQPPPECLSPRPTGEGMSITGSRRGESFATALSSNAYNDDASRARSSVDSLTDLAALVGGLSRQHETATVSQNAVTSATLSENNDIPSNAPDTSAIFVDTETQFASKKDVGNEAESAADDLTQTGATVEQTIALSSAFAPSQYTTTNDAESSRSSRDSRCGYFPAAASQAQVTDRLLSLLHILEAACEEELQASRVLPSIFSEVKERIWPELVKQCEDNGKNAAVGASASAMAQGAAQSKKEECIQRVVDVFVGSASKEDARPSSQDRTRLRRRAERFLDTFTTAFYPSAPPAVQPSRDSSAMEVANLTGIDAFFASREKIGSTFGNWARLCEDPMLSFPSRPTPVHRGALQIPVSPLRHGAIEPPKALESLDGCGVLGTPWPSIWPLNSSACAAPDAASLVDITGSSQSKQSRAHHHHHHPQQQRFHQHGASSSRRRHPGVASPDAGTSGEATHGGRGGSGTGGALSPGVGGGANGNVQRVLRGYTAGVAAGSPSAAPPLASGTSAGRTRVAPSGRSPSQMIPRIEANPECSAFLSSAAIAAAQNAAQDIALLALSRAAAPGWVEAKKKPRVEDVGRPAAISFACLLKEFMDTGGDPGVSNGRLFFSILHHPALSSPAALPLRSEEALIDACTNPASFAFAALSRTFTASRSMRSAFASLSWALPLVQAVEPMPEVPAEPGQDFTLTLPRRLEACLSLDSFNADDAYFQVHTETLAADLELRRFAPPLDSIRPGNLFPVKLSSYTVRHYPTPLGLGAPPLGPATADGTDPTLPLAVTLPLSRSLHAVLGQSYLVLADVIAVTTRSKVPVAGSSQAVQQRRFRALAVCPLHFTFTYRPAESTPCLLDVRVLVRDRTTLGSVLYPGGYLLPRTSVDGDNSGGLGGSAAGDGPSGTRSSGQGWNETGSFNAGGHGSIANAVEERYNNILVQSPSATHPRIIGFTLSFESAEHAAQAEAHIAEARARILREKFASFRRMGPL